MSTKDFINKKIIANPDANSTEKYKSTIYLSHSTYTKVESLKNLCEIPTRNAVIERAIDFFYGYHSGNISEDYLCGILGSKLEAVINRSNDRISRLLYKQAVETNMMTRLLAGSQTLPKDTYERMRKKAAQDVKENNGIVDIYKVSLENI
jgi:hypothetical protein